MLTHTELFSKVSGLGLSLGLIHCGLGLGLETFFRPRLRPRPHSFWPWPHAQLASLTSLAVGKWNSDIQ